MNDSLFSRSAVLALAFTAVILAMGGARLSAGEPGVVSPGQVYPITLETALRLADERNTVIALHLQQMKQAVLAEKAAYFEWLPTIRAGGSYVEQDGALQSTGGAVSNVDRDARYAGLGAGAVGSGLPSVAGATVEIDLAKAIFEPLAARQLTLATRAADEATRARVFLQVAEGYYGLVRAHQAVTIAGQAKADARKLAEITGNFAETGEGLLADAERAAVESLLMEEAEESAKGERATASAGLARLLRLDDAIRLEPAGNYVVPLSIVSAETGDSECLARALTQRPELREHHALVEAARAALKERKFSPLIPKLRAAYSYGDFRGGADGGPTNSGDRHDVGVALYWQLNGLGFLQRNQAKRRESELREAELGEGQILSDIIAEVKIAHGLLVSADRRLSVTKRAVARARKGYALNRERIFQNEGLPLESLQAMQALATAERLHLRAATDYNVAQLRLHTAMGSHLPEEVGQGGK